MLTGYLVLVGLFSAAVMTAMQVVGEKGIYLAGVYMRATPILL